MGNWYEGGPKIRKILGIFMEKTKQQVTMRPGGFFSLTLNTFTQVILLEYRYSKGQNYNFILILQYRFFIICKLFGYSV